jgi:hypothetical protein
MAEWVYIQNNEILEYHDKLPKSWRTISGLDKANITFLNSVGWFKVEKQYQSFDEKTHRTDGYNYEIQPDKVIETLNLIELSINEINEIENNRKQSFFSHLKTERNRRLLESDWTQLNDVIEKNTQQWTNSWKTYRQELRDIVQKYEQMDMYNIEMIEWPKLNLIDE